MITIRKITAIELETADLKDKSSGLIVIRTRGISKNRASFSSEYLKQTFVII